MVLLRSARRWWTQSNPILLMQSQNKLLNGLVNAAFKKISVNGVNGVEFTKASHSSESLDTVVLTHGFGSGLGFFYRNVDCLLSSSSVGRVLLVDWLGMGGSERPQCSQRPIRGWNECTTSWCDSRYSPSEAVEFFIDPFTKWMKEVNMNKNGKLTLVGHSLGGYLSARFVLLNPSMVDKLVLASPVGFPKKPSNAFKGSQLPTSLRVLDALWSSNMTPQQLVRLMGPSRGKANTKRALRGRIPHLSNTDFELLADYLYHITVADPSGEFAMNSLLEPVIASDIMGIFAREPLEEYFLNLTSLSTLKSIKVLFGDHDWMRPNESSARKTMKLIEQKFGIKTSTNIVISAGHHLYLDNSNDFVTHILED